MSNLMDFLGQIEKLAYSLAVWIILIPKTIFKIILEPTWVRGYIAKEFAESAEVEKTGKSGDKVRFDDYVSPVILLLLCSLVPYVGYQLLPPFGLAGIVGTDTCVVNQPCSYDIDANYFDNAYVIDWQFRDLSNANVDNQHETVYANSALSDDNMTFRITGKQEIQWTTPGDKEVSIQIKDG